MFYPYLFNAIFTWSRVQDYSPVEAFFLFVVGILPMAIVVLITEVRNRCNPLARASV